MNAPGPKSKLPGNLVREEILALKAYPVASASGMIKLDAMENPYRLPEALREEVARTVSTLPINRYPDPTAPELKARLREVFDIPEACGILLGNGSDEIIQIVIQALARPGATLLAPEPSFVMYRTNALLAGVRYVGVPLAPDFTLDLGRVLAAMREARPALVFVAYPNNPTGNLFPEDAVARIIEEAPGLVVVDEAYHVFAGRTFMHRLREFPNLMVMRTVSKLGLAGIRLGYAAASAEWIAEFDKVRPPYNVNMITQFVAERVLGRVAVLEKQAEAIKTERESLFGRLRDLNGVEAFPSDANFILVRVPDADAVSGRLRERRVLIRNFHGSHPLLANCLRLTVGTPGENALMLDALSGSL
ncbi:MAG: histidinol-phosphate transaminase [Betaproteobacteria bacterium]|nr:histidinol-phosphate transaminase [Betaproteobacteria bacterium]